MKKLSPWRRPYLARKVLEVGGGHSPYSGVTHAVDKFPEDNTQRGGDYLLPSGARFFAGELESLPFPKGEVFDFLYASHVFEHVRDPQRAAAEIARITRKGYVETPSPLREQLACPIPFDAEGDFHTFFCWSTGGTFHCVRKSAATIGQFPESRAGQIAHALFRLQREEGVDLEPLLSREAKTTRHFFSRGFELREHSDFLAAATAGACAYESSIATLEQDISFPFRLRSKRFRRLRQLLQGKLP